MPILNIALQHREYLRPADATIRHLWLKEATAILRRIASGDTFGGVGQGYTSATAAMSATPATAEQVVVTDAAAYATQTITWSGAGSNGDTVTIGGITFTAVAAGPTAIQYVTGGTLAATAANFAAQVNAHTTLSAIMTATPVAGVVTLTMTVPGVVGNVVTLAKVAAAVTLGGTALAGGAGTVVTFAG